MDNFLIVDREKIKEGLSTDVYFTRTEEVLREKGINPTVVAEVTMSSGDLGVLAGLNEVAKLLEGKDLDVYAMDEGTIFYSEEPVLVIEGKYFEFARYETALLGFLCHASGIATKAFRTKLKAGGARVMSFGTRRQHPALATFIEKYAYLGGMDGISNVAAGNMLGIEPMGTMPHSLIICFGDQIKAWKAFDEVIAKKVPRICLCDTYADEKTESIMAAEVLPALNAVRLDTPSSRRGDLKKIVREIRWELDLRGYDDVGIFISGGIDEEDLEGLSGLVDGFGIGTSVANAPAIDFALDIVEKEGKPCAKRGKLGGKKQVYRNWDEMEDKVLPATKGERDMEILLHPIIKNGEIVREFPLEKSRERVLRQLEIFKTRLNEK